MTVAACEPALKLFPKILQDHELFAAFSIAWAAEAGGLGSKCEERHKKFKEITMRLWPAISGKESGVEDAEVPQDKQKLSKESPENSRQQRLNRMAKK